jgi:phenylalanyl-tRNA synthetase alpha chain
MKDQVLSLKNEALAQILQAGSAAELENIRIRYLGKDGAITRCIRTIKNVEPSERADTGKIINEAKYTVEVGIAERKIKLSGRMSSEKLDLTLPGIEPSIGHLHLVTRAIDEISSIFEKIGFVRVRYPQVEWDWYAFGSLNMSPGHPARDEWETFFVDSPASKKFGEKVLTPHTSSGQVREMERMGRPPIRMMNIAKCYRRQSDVSHTPMFHQFEGLVIDKGISISHLKGTIDYFVHQFFGTKRRSRIRPFHFQFTEPSFEVDVTCDICRGKGCRLCKEGWLELGGAGMVHPVVLRNGGVDTNKFTGFAFGWGVERTYMMKSGLKIDDLRLLYSHDLRYLKQF